MTPQADATLDALSFRAKDSIGVMWPELRRRLLDDMDTARVLMKSSETIAFDADSQARQENGRPARCLLAAIVKKLRAIPMKADDAREVAARIVGLCGADTLVIDADSIKRANRRGKKRP